MVYIVMCTNVLRFIASRADPINTINFCGHYGYLLVLFRLIVWGRRSLTFICIRQVFNEAVTPERKRKLSQLSGEVAASVRGSFFLHKGYVGLLAFVCWTQCKAVEATWN
jgi:hypothetical protein